MDEIDEKISYCYFCLKFISFNVRFTFKIKINI